MGTRRVVIVVEPRLLADTLARALHGSDIEVTLSLATSPGESETFDVAVVKGAVGQEITADVIVRLPDPEAAEVGSITTADGTEPAVLNDLASLLETLNRFIRS